MNCLRLVVAISAMTLAVFAGPKPGAAQLVVFDPNNYAQNVLTAARARGQYQCQPHSDVRAGHLEPGRDRRAAGEPGRQSASGATSPATRRSHGRRCRPRPRAEPGVGPACRGAGPEQGATPSVPDARPRPSNHNRADVSLMNTKTLARLPPIAAVAVSCRPPRP